MEINGEGEWAEIEIKGEEEWVKKGVREKKEGEWGRKERGRMGE